MVQYSYIYSEPSPILIPGAANKVPANIPAQCVPHSSTGLRRLSLFGSQYVCQIYRSKATTNRSESDGDRERPTAVPNSELVLLTMDLSMSATGLHQEAASRTLGSR
jgi:hypothetical protein